MAIIIFLIILSVLVIIHELGHFLAAKKVGIGVEEIGFGLPPRAWGKKIKNTIYSINWLPFGGFVRLVGEDPTDKKKKQKNSFFIKPAWQRFLVVVAGVFINFIFAILIFYIVVFALGFKVSLPLLVEHRFKFVNQSSQVLVAEIGEKSPAEIAGIKTGDSILKIDGENILTIDQLQKIVRSSDSKELTLILENPINNQQRQVKIMPKYNEQLKASVLGIGLGELVVLKYDTLPQKIFSGFIHSYNTVEYSGKVFAKLIGFAIRERNIAPVSEGVAGPVGIAQMTSQVVSLGFISVLQLVGLLSLNLAVVNILPLPALDGGRLFFIVVEVVTRKRVHPVFEKWVHNVGFALLIGLIVLITYNDILKLLR